MLLKKILFLSIEYIYIDTRGIISDFPWAEKLDINTIDVKTTQFDPEYAF